MSWSYLPHTEGDRRAMLASIGVETVDELFVDVPAALKLNRPLNLPRAMAESELVKHLQAMSAENANIRDYTCFLGAGAYDHYIPSVVNHIISRSEFYTAYTQYQPEISQGYLQALWEYQSMICEITGMEVANASMYDGGTALAEAAMMACGATGRDEIVVSRTIHPYYREVLKTYGIDRGYKFRDISYADADGTTDIKLLEKIASESTAAIIIQSPNFFGTIEDLKAIAEIAHAKGVLFVASVDPISLGILESPGRLGADIVVGEGQSMGLPISFGGPYLGFFAATGKLMRRMPGRIIGQTADAEGRRGFVLTLQTREQHIRREKATSNICSNEALCALAAVAYVSAVGKQGFQEIAAQCMHKARYAYERLTTLKGCQPVFNAPFFKEFVVRFEKPVTDLNRSLLASGIIGGFDLGKQYPEMEQCMLVCITEKRTKYEIDRLVEKMGAIL
jgi:glycine dehydrogenase subunit 1